MGGEGPNKGERIYGTLRMGALIIRHVRSASSLSMRGKEKVGTLGLVGKTHQGAESVWKHCRGRRVSRKAKEKITSTPRRNGEK